MKLLAVSVFVMLSLVSAAARAQTQSSPDDASAAAGVPGYGGSDTPAYRAPGPMGRESEDETVTTRRAPERPPAFRPTPTLKLSYVKWSIGNVDNSAVPLDALHLDMFSISRPWFRLGFETEAGRGKTSFSGTAASLRYGLLGVNLGFQIPGRVTPFVVGHLAGGVLSPKLEEPLAIGTTGVSVSGASATTWMYTRGLEAGLELYPLGPLVLSGSVGWTRSTWGSADYDALVATQTLKFKDVTHDSVLFKLGIGF